MSPRSTLKSLVRLGKMRWHVERDYPNMKQQLGFGGYEGRSWAGCAGISPWSRSCTPSSSGLHDELGLE